MYFHDAEHEKRYYDLLLKADKGRGVIQSDLERVSCLYLIALISGKGSKSADNYYNFDTNSIRPDSISRAELTGSSRRVLRLAYVLYNGFPAGDDATAAEHYRDNSIDNLLDYAGDFGAAMIEAMCIRYRIDYNTD